jgi:acyl-coenzyme A synthetase/AMP-(fatty) acid ligase
VILGPIAERFARVSFENPDRVAIYGLSENVTRTFSQLAADVEALKRALPALGLPSRPTIVSNVGNRTGFVPLFLSSLESGGCLLPLDGDAPAQEVLEMADAYGAHVVVIPADVNGFEGTTPMPLPCGLAAIVREPSIDSWSAPDGNEPLVLKVTSGSTGASKIVMASEFNLVSDGLHVMEAMDIRSNDVGVATVPMAHSYGIGNLLLPLVLAGSPIVLRDRFVPAQWASDVSRFGVTMFPGVPYIFDYLRRLGEAAAPLAKIRLVVTAGAPIDVGTLIYFKDQLGIKIHSLYGTTETGSITYDSSDVVYDPVSVGWAMPETTVTLTPAPDLDIAGGRVLVQGSAVTNGYAHDEPDLGRPSAFTAGGFLTADLGEFGEDGRLTLRGRISDFVNVAGRKVHPGEVERTIAQLPDVEDVRVMGVAGGARGQDLIAFVRRRTGEVSAGSIRAHCAAMMAPHKVPRRVVFADELPVDWRGKTDRRTLESLLIGALGKLDDI